MQIKTQHFEPIDAMEGRTQFGALLDRTSEAEGRFIITRRGEAKALLVPIGDQKFIEEGIEDEVYEAITNANGAISDPTLADASRTVDEWVYGQARQEQHGK
jgi:prevent-host-death family protein